MKVVILGLSYFGLQCAEVLHRAGCQLSLIDRNPNAFNRLAADVQALQVLGTGIDEDVLKKAGVGDAELFIAATGSDNANLMAAQVAKVVFGTPRCIARMHDQNNGALFSSLGLVETICPTYDAARAVEASLPRK